MSKIKHPRALAIASKGERHLFEMGDYVIERAGTPNRQTKAAAAVIDEIAEELCEHGHNKYKTSYLWELRTASHAFPNSERSEFAWYIHRVAGSPKILRAAIAAAKHQGVRVTAKFVRTFIQTMDVDGRAQRQARKASVLAAQEAAFEAEAAVREAHSPSAIKAAEAKADEAREALRTAREEAGERVSPRGKNKAELEPPNPEDVPTLFVRVKFSADVAEVTSRARKMDEEIAPHIDELSPVSVRAYVSQLLAAAEMLRKLADKLNRNQPNKRGHLRAVS